MTVEKFSVFGDGKISASKDILCDLCHDLFMLASYVENDPRYGKELSDSYNKKATTIYDALDTAGYYRHTK